MIPVSNDYRRQLIAGNRNWLIKVNMTLADGTILNLTNEHIWDNGIVLDNAISSDSSFDIGSAIVGSLKVVIDNITGNFSQYDFFDATLVLWLGVEGDVDSSDVQRYYRIGFYVVDVPSYNGSLITLNCLDNMIWFDAPFEEVTGITYPANAGTVVQAICSYVGVTLGTPAFPNYADPWTQILAAPEQQLSCREVLQYIAQMCCCYCKIDTAGQLVLKWYNKQEILGITNYDGGTYNTTTTPYSDGCDLDGGHFMYGGDSADGGTFQDLLDTVWISNNYDIEVSTDDVVVTGCRVRNNASKESAYDVLWVDSTVEQDHDRYVLVIDSNPFIPTETIANHIANIVGQTLAGLPIRGFTATSLADFSYETGDMATIVDFRGNRYYSWITHSTFTTNNSEQFACGVESLKKRSEQRFSTIAETYEKAKVALTAYDKAVKAMNELAQNSIDFTEYVYPVGAGVGTARTMWRYNGASVDTTTPNNPKFPDSTVVFKIAGDGVFVSTSKDEQGYEIFSNGYDANSGTAILNTLYAKGISCDSIHSGTLTLGGYGNINGWLKILNASGQQIGKWDADGISASNGTFSGALSGASGSFSGTVSAGTINGATKFSMQAKASSHTTSLNWGDTWGDSLTVVIGDNGAAGLGVAKNRETQAVYMHYNDVRLYDNEYTAQYAQFEYHSSDKRLKKNIKDVNENLLEKLFIKIRPVTFKYKKSDKQQFGLIAQELIEILDELGIDKSQYVEKDENGYYLLKYNRLYKLSMLATHELYGRLNEQQSEIDLLKQELADLKARIK